MVWAKWNQAKKKGQWGGWWGHVLLGHCLFAEANATLGWLPMMTVLRSVCLQ